MKERKEILGYGMTLPDVYMDAPFHNNNWILLSLMDEVWYNARVHLSVNRDLIGAKIK